MAATPTPEWCRWEGNAHACTASTQARSLWDERRGREGWKIEKSPISYGALGMLPSVLALPMGTRQGQKGSMCDLGAQGDAENREAGTEGPFP